MVSATPRLLPIACAISYAHRFRGAPAMSRKTLVRAGDDWTRPTAGAAVGAWVGTRVSLRAGSALASNSASVG